MIYNIKINERLLSLFFCGSLFLSTFSHADEYPKPYFISDSFSYSETVSIKSSFHSWKGDDFDSGERQWTWNWFEVGVRYKHWGVGLLQRYDYDLRFSQETAEFFWLTKNKRELPTGRKYSLDLQANAIHSTGLRISFTDSLTDSFNYNFGLSYLQASYTLNGQIEGDATAINDSDYDFQGVVDYAYTEDPLFDRQVKAPEGKGFSIDFMFDYQVTQKVHWQLQVRDLLARLYWENSPYTQGRATSERKEYDENGYVSIDPLLKGYEGIKDVYVQKLQPRWYSKVDYGVSDSNALVAQLRYQYEHALYALGVDHKIADNHHLGLHYWPINQTVEINWDYHTVQVAIGTDAFSTSDMKTFWLSLSYGL